MPKPRKPKPEGEKESRMGKTLDPFEEYFISPSPGPSSRPQQSRQPPGPLPQSECTDEQCYSDGQQGTNDKAYKQLKEIGDIVVQYDPVHAVLPWAGVRFIPMLIIGHQEKLAAAIIAMERIAILIGRCTIYEQLYLNSNDVPDIAEDLHIALLAFYTAILQAGEGL